MSDAEPCPDGRAQLELVRKGVNAVFDELAERLSGDVLLTCPYCDVLRERVPPARVRWVALGHLASCPSHPMRAVERERDELRERVAALELRLAGHQPTTNHKNTAEV